MGPTTLREDIVTLHGTFAISRPGAPVEVDTRIRCVPAVRCPLVDALARTAKKATLLCAAVSPLPWTLRCFAFILACNTVRPAARPDSRPFEGAFPVRQRRGRFGTQSDDNCWRVRLPSHARASKIRCTCMIALADYTSGIPKT